MNKKDGIDFLSVYNLPTINLLSLNDLCNNPELITQGLSLRLSGKANAIDVMLPSIHNVRTLDEVLTFYHQYQNNYNILIHKTITPTIIGSISKYLIDNYTIIAIETFDDFKSRKQEKVGERALILLLDDYILRINDSNFQNKKLLNAILRYIKEIPYETFDLEFVVDDNLIFTDFYSKNFSARKHLQKKINSTS